MNIAYHINFTTFGPLQQLTQKKTNNRTEMHMKNTLYYEKCQTTDLVFFPCSTQ
jgi:hypothetical protein